MFKDPDTDRTQMMDSDSMHKMPCVGEFAKIERVDGRKIKVVMKDKNAFFPVGATVQSRLTLREQLRIFRAVQKRTNGKRNDKSDARLGNFSAILR